MLTFEAMAVKPYTAGGAGKKEQVKEMFNNIAFRYDLLNRLLSAGIDTLWRKRAIAKLKNLKPQRILDVATGTADLAIEALSLDPEKITGLDLSPGMLEVGRRKIEEKGLENKIDLMQGDSEALPFGENAFDAVTVAFGVRNFENLAKGLKEMNRVLRPGGKVVVLEFSQPTVFPVKQLYRIYFKTILPFIGQIISKDKRAYTYLPESVDAFPFGKKFIEQLQQAGFRNCEADALMFGIASIYTGEK